MLFRSIEKANIDLLKDGIKPGQSLIIPTKIVQKEEVKIKMFNNLILYCYHILNLCSHLYFDI